LLKDVALGVDKLSEWNPATVRGCANLLFARMMLNVYDVLIEHEWGRFHESQSVTNVDRMTALLERRKEVKEVLREKSLRRKESKAGTTDGGPSVELKQADVLINCFTLTQIFETIVPPESSSVEVLHELRSELLDWAINRMLSLSKSLLDGFHPLHSIFCETSTLIFSAGFLLDYYTSTNCADWIESRELANPSKTWVCDLWKDKSYEALEAYANILLYLSTKYRSQPIKVIPISIYQVVASGVGIPIV
uniref:FANCI_HD2 domain-containing protein n=1 Tax=Angiostrongylus cantonensis TaxID=6313 RepID=A0A0K0D6Y7_ANGCA